MGSPDRRPAAPGGRPGPRSSRKGHLVLAACALLGTGPAVGAVEGSRAPDAWSIARDLAMVGPRVPGTPAHGEARRLLLEAMRAVGLEEVEVRGEPSGGDGPLQITGRLPGSEPGEILVTAHYDTVPGSPGASDDASGCGVALAAVADLGRTPRRRSVRVVLFDDEERGQAGSRAWVEGMSREERTGTLAALSLEMLGGLAGAGGVAVTLPSAGGRGLGLAPGWLVHAALEGASAVGFDLAMLDVRRSLAAQLAIRTGRPAIASDAESLLGGGVPALLLSDLSLSRTDPTQHRPADEPDRLSPERLAEWTKAVASIVRRLDALEGRPRHDTEYLVVGGAVRTRRDLLWLCFGAWVLMVWRGLPGAWRGRGGRERRRKGRLYLPGFAFRGLFLVSSLLAPVLSVTLLVPAALASLARPLFRRRPLIPCLLGLAPAGLYAILMGRGALEGWIRLDGSGLVGLALVTATLATFSVLMLGPEPEPAAT